jgi:predicted DCC family thiol-disulfide oxidoreductase YuxK
MAEPSVIISGALRLIDTEINLLKTKIMSSLQTQSYSSDNPLNQPPSWKIKLLYDGECPLCVREVNFLMKRDAGRGLVAFVDIAADDYNPEVNGGVDYETAMGRIHAVLPEGTLVKNVEVFRRVYETLGMGWVYAATKLPIVGAIANFIYGIWADLRLSLTGRPSLATIVQQRSSQKVECNTGNRCRLTDGDDSLSA